MRFRNGLRAIAVIGVVLFHFKASWVPGGFAGVDVFFVISGFLMTKIIFQGLAEQKFSVLGFYLARANRIIPALSMVCLVLLVFGWFYLAPSDYSVLGKHVSSSIGFFSNITYLQEGGYFDAASHEKWLLHTWSLSVEWQFYMIYPLVLVIMSKVMSLRAMKIAILIGTILGTLLCIVATYKWPNPAYYLLPSRAWEMLIGGIAYIYPASLTSKRSKVVGSLGLILILASYFFFSKNTIWPGYLAIVPVFGAFLIIQAQQVNSLVTGHVVFQKIGSWSYSIYLWHWPLVIAIFYFSLSEIYLYLGIVCSILLGYISNRYIEKANFSKGFVRAVDFFKYKPAYMVLFLGIVGSVVFRTNGFESHYSESVIIASKEAQNMNPRRGECLVATGKVPECVYGVGKLGAIVIGDSHAQSIIRSVEKALPANRSVMDWTMAGCRTIENIYSFNNSSTTKHACGNFIDYALNEIKKYPQIPIVIDNRYAAMLYGPNELGANSNNQIVTELIPVNKTVIYRNTEYFKIMNDAFINTVCKLAEHNPVFVLQQTPEMKLSVPKAMAKELMRGNLDFRVQLPRDEYIKRNEMFEGVVDNLKRKCNISYIQLVSKFCDDDFCYGDIDGRPVFLDDDHLSEFGASQLIPLFQSLIIPKIPL